jgi:photosystem II stability/assembly factor-like uncharacterized protein
MEDLRGVHMQNDGALVLMNSGNKGTIWTVDAIGKKEISFDSIGVFLDGISFYPDDDQNGIAYGDPIGNKFMVFKTKNAGTTWQPIEPASLPPILKNEAGFAGSNTGIQTPETNVILIGTGISDTARILRSFDDGDNWDVINTPIRSGDHYGIYSMYFKSKNEGFIIGGSYKDSAYNEKICYYTMDGGLTWVNKSDGLPGYMSCIYGNKDLSMIVATGRTGTYYSTNKGSTWNVLTETPYYTCLMTSNKIVLSGKYGIFEVFDYALKNQ